MAFTHTPNVCWHCVSCSGSDRICCGLRALALSPYVVFCIFFPFARFLLYVFLFLLLFLLHFHCTLSTICSRQPYFFSLCVRCVGCESASTATDKGEEEKRSVVSRPWTHLLDRERTKTKTNAMLVLVMNYEPGARLCIKWVMGMARLIGRKCE